MKKKPKKRRRITATQFNRMKVKTLDDILALVNGGRYDGFIRKRPKVIDGNTAWTESCFTKAGEDAYATLCEILFAVGELLSVEAYRSIEDAVCELDNTMEPFIKRKETT